MFYAHWWAFLQGKIFLFRLRFFLLCGRFGSSVEMTVLTDIPPPPPKVAKFSFMVPTEMQCFETDAKQFSDFFKFFCLTSFSFYVSWDFSTKNFGGKFTIAPLSLNLGSAHISEESRKVEKYFTKKNVAKYFWQKKIKTFFSRFFRIVWNAF